MHTDKTGFLIVWIKKSYGNNIFQFCLNLLARLFTSKRTSQKLPSLITQFQNNIVKFHNQIRQIKTKTYIKALYPVSNQRRNAERSERERETNQNELQRDVFREGIFNFVKYKMRCRGLFSPFQITFNSYKINIEFNCIKTVILINKKINCK